MNATSEIMRSAISTAPMAIPAFAPVERPDEEDIGEREEGVEAPPAVNEDGVVREVEEEVDVIAAKTRVSFC